MRYERLFMSYGHYWHPRKIGSFHPLASAPFVSACVLHVGLEVEVAVGKQETNTWVHVE